MDEHPSRRTEYELRQRRRAQDEEDARVALELTVEQALKSLALALRALPEHPALAAGVIQGTILLLGGTLEDPGELL